MFHYEYIDSVLYLLTHQYKYSCLKLDRYSDNDLFHKLHLCNLYTFYHHHSSGNDIYYKNQYH